jgi:4-hydroxybenzoate polyprenyltransferase
MAKSTARHSRWLTYIRERFPLPTYLLLSGCLCWSGAALGHHRQDARPWFGPAALGMLGLLLFFFELRLMDELKDFTKDQIAHPARPLPRGLITEREARTLVGVLLVAMIGFSLVIAMLGQPEAAMIYGLITGYLFLMFKEFFAGEGLSRRPFVYGFTHQIILMPLVAFPVALFHHRLWAEPETWKLGLSVLGAFFTYELCRKLDPSAHPVLRTYPQVYGRGGTLFRISLTSATALLGTSLLHIEAVGAPVVMLTWIAAVIWVMRPHCHKWVEAMATISLLVHLACIPLFEMVQRWS